MGLQLYQEKHQVTVLLLLYVAMTPIRKWDCNIEVSHSPHMNFCPCSNDSHKKMGLQLLYDIARGEKPSLNLGSNDSHKKMGLQHDIIFL